MDMTPRTSFTGRLTRDAELRSLAEGKQVCNLRVAYSQRSEKQPTGYFDVEVWDTYAGTCAALRKGARVAISGRIHFSEWESAEGGRRSGYRIAADEVIFLDPKGDSESPAQAQAEPVAA